MNNYAKSLRGKISPTQLFFIIFVSRIVVTLTYVQTVSVGKISTDFLFSIALSYILTMLFSIPIIMCIKQRKMVIFKAIYSIYFIWLASVNISRFSYFASSRINANSSMIFFIIAIVVASCYCAVLGLEGVSRFGSFCGLLLLITVGIVLAFNLHNLHALNYFPATSNSRIDILKNAIIMTSNSAEPAIALVIFDKVNGNRIKPLIGGISASYLTVFILIVFVIGVMGGASSLQSYPIFTLFQMASVGSFSRLDMLHTAFWVLALLLKSSVFIYASSVTIMKFNHGKKCACFSALIVVFSVLIVFVFGTAMIEITKYASTISFAVFCFLLPLITIFTRRKSLENN